jgi:hypothetical protein
LHFYSISPPTLLPQQDMLVGSWFPRICISNSFVPGRAAAIANAAITVLLRAFVFWRHLTDENWLIRAVISAGTSTACVYFPYLKWDYRSQRR